MSKLVLTQKLKPSLYMCWHDVARWRRFRIGGCSSGCETLPVIARWLCRLGESEKRPRRYRCEWSDFAEMGRSVLHPYRKRV